MIDITRIFSLLSVVGSMRDPYDDGHESRVSILCSRLAAKINMSAGDLYTLMVASRLHDIGKMVLPDSYIHKTQLSKVEMAMVRNHVNFGEHITSELRLEDDRIPRVIRQHHENWDGSGYMDGISGEAIDIGARIIRIADSWDAITSDRVYRKKLGKVEARNELMRYSGQWYDPRILKSFLEIIDG